VNQLQKIRIFLEKNQITVLISVLSLISISSFIYYYQNGLGLAYNDARSHLDIGRRIVEGLTPGMGQLGSVWLPLNHLLMVPTIWNDFMWHSGLAGTIQSMLAYVMTGIIIFLFLKELNVGILGRLAGVAVFSLNPNILYLQSTAMTELLLLATMMAGCYYLLLWYKKDKISYLLLAASCIMLSTLVRYDGWFLLFSATALMFFFTWKKNGWKEVEGKIFLFCILGGLGIFLWVLWNLMIFHDPLYFIFGPYSAFAQQEQMAASGVLYAKSHLLVATKIYFYAVVENVGIFNLILATVGSLIFFLSKKVTSSSKYASLLLLVPFIFNIVALYFGHTIIMIPGLSGDKLFNIRYGIMMMPAVAIFVGIFVERFKFFRWAIIFALIIFNVWTVTSVKAVSLLEPQIGTDQKEAVEIGTGIQAHAGNKSGLILISAYTHDASVFSSMLPMKRFIHEGNDKYYYSALKEPGSYVRWIVMKTNYDGDVIWRELKNNTALEKYAIIDHYSFADIYELKEEYLYGLISNPVFK
jgi:hypothetical protein